MLNLSQKTIKELRQSGYKCRIHHHRHVKQDDNSIIENVPLMDIQNMNKVLAKGGKTELFVTTPDGKNYKSIAVCNSRDSFNYKLAVRIALGRLQEQN